MESSCCIKVSPFQLLTFSLIFFPLYHAYDAPFEEDQLNQEANRLGVAIVTDDHFVKENFGGNSDAAFNHTISLFQAKKETLESIFNHTFGFDLLAIKLSHPAFSQINLEQQTPGVINVTELKSSVRLREALSTELFAYPLVLYMTNRAFSDGHYGLKLGSADSPPHNLVAVSLSGLGLRNGSFSEIGLGRKHRNPSKRLLILLIHELLHGVGLPHSNNTDNDLMKEFSPVGLNMSDNTRTLAEMLFQAAQDEGLLSPHDDTVRLVTYSVDGQPNEKLVSFQNVVEYMLEKHTDRLSFWTQIWKYVSQLPMLFWLSPISVTALICAVFCVWILLTSTQENEAEVEEGMEMPSVESSRAQSSVSIIVSLDLTTSMSDILPDE